MPLPTRLKVMLATSDQACRASRVALIWVAEKREKPEVSSGMSAGAVARKAKVTVAESPQSSPQLTRSRVSWTAASSMVSEGLPVELVPPRWSALR